MRVWFILHEAFELSASFIITDDGILARAQDGVLHNLALIWENFIRTGCIFLSFRIF